MGAGEWVVASTVLQVISEQTARWPDAPAIVAAGGGTITYRRLWHKVTQIAEALRAAGIGRGDHVAIVVDNGPEMAVTFLGVTAVATAAPLNPAYRQSELDFYLSDLNARALIVSTERETAAVAAARSRAVPIIALPLAESDQASDIAPDAIVAPTAAAEADDVALVLHTSGTTARPKIVPLTHRNLCISAQYIAKWLELSPADRCLNVMPLFHVHGLVAALLSSLSSGGSVVCTPGFVAPQFWGWLKLLRPTWYTAVPTMHQAILARPRRRAHRRH